MIFSEKVVAGDREATLVPTPTQFDNGAEVNVIDQRFVLEHNLEPVEAPLSSVKWINDNTTFCYAAYLVHYELQDSWSHTKRCSHIFYVIAKEDNSFFVLRLSALTDEDIVIDIARRTWRFDIDAHTHEILSLQDFVNALEREKSVYALVITDIFDASARNHHIDGARANTSQSQAADAASKLPEELREYEDVFSTEEVDRLPSHEERDYVIETTAKSLFDSLYNLSNIELATLRTYLDDILAKDWIQYSTSSVESLILFVSKKNNDLRLCVDYRELNKVTIKNRHPLPLISETLNRLNEAKRFTKFNLKDTYHRIRIRKGDEWKTAFRTRYGHFEYLIMPFGLTNAPTTFQAYINKSLTGLIDNFCVVYLDDILIYSSSQEEHLNHVKQVLERLRRFSLYASLKKCEFFITEVEFLDFMVSINGVAMNKRRMKAIQKWPRPKSFHKI